MAAQDILQKVARWPIGQKLLVLVALVLIMGVLFFFFLIQPKYDEIARLDAKLQEKQTELNKTKTIAERLDRFKQEADRLHADFEKALKKLPETANIAGLLERIDNLGRGVGIQFESFQPKGETRKGFYAAVRVDMKISGSYHQIAIFLDKISKLDRIVNVSDLDLKPVRGGRLIKGKCSLTTFRFINK